MLTFLDVALFVWLCCCWLLLALPYPWFVSITATNQGYGSARRSQQQHSHTKRATSRNVSIGSLAEWNARDAFGVLYDIYKPVAESITFWPGAQGVTPQEPCP